MHLIIVFMCIMMGSLVAGESEDTSPPWPNYFTKLIGQEMDCLDRVPGRMRPLIIKECKPTASFSTIAALIISLRKAANNPVEAGPPPTD